MMDSMCRPCAPVTVAWYERSNCSAAHVHFVQFVSWRNQLQCYTRQAQHVLL
jgi:hypothetical protein